MEEMQRLRAEAEEQGEDAVKALQERMQARKTYGPGAVSAEHDTYLEATIGHPQMLALARAVLGEDIRFDHQVALIKHGGHAGQQWHTHQYLLRQTFLWILSPFRSTVSFLWEQVRERRPLPLLGERRGGDRRGGGEPDLDRRPGARFHPHLLRACHGISLDLSFGALSNTMSVWYSTSTASSSTTVR